MNAKTDQYESNASFFKRSEICKDPCYRMRFYPSLASASIDKPHIFAETILAIFRNYFPIKAASLYIYNEDVEGTVQSFSHIWVDSPLG